ncbi:hypothetical protein [Actinoplanes subtropicus]|uniref:hypothetical protein n=1 Tax=Actinoplanes subtropicus TaxID=543632 RepID=UPI0004C34087|nr:hypothetical protein [Actinoplanes subtropicus]
MSLSSLRSFGGAASFATTAFDTARTTFKAMADAAVPPAGADSSVPNGSKGSEASSGTGSHAAGERTQGAAASSASATGSGEVRREAERSPAEKRKAGIRKGVALDAYA